MALSAADPVRVKIEILDGNSRKVTTIETHDPEWSFKQFCRNRHTPQWCWREIPATAARPH
ncbi:hypothetical protein [Defluviimonas salinarum]|uniref:Transposase n=1 Tax=Defluviimonas salinarum TaxID=2992147 RepID=A0ABT3J8A1_9RHOB|nr:hypothetical protein [Defluviimonas salinarum]MCW3783885.1 hypothetical protein [Defluviimonas salinarum]